MKPFDAAAFARDGHAVVDALAGHLARAHARDVVPVRPRETMAELCARFPAEYTRDGTGDLLGALATVVTSSTSLHAPGFMGHQVATPLPAAALCELAVTLLNNSTAVSEMGPAAAATERAVLAHLSARAGYGPNSGGVLTSGGSVGELTALLAARQAKAGYDAWTRGLRSGPQLVVFVAKSAHYSLSRAAHMLGLGDAGVVAVDVDDAQRMDLASLELEIARAQRRGHRPIAVVASAGSTAVGAIDPLDAIADICALHNLWMHVDGAHGASLLMSDTHRDKLHGIARADSIVWDAHKLMMMPALCTAVLFKDGATGAAAFAQEAGYLFVDDGDAWAEIGRRTVECTKPAMSVVLDTCLRTYGTRLFAEHIGG